MTQSGCVVRRVLVVDDDPVVRELVGCVLERAGFFVIAVGSARAGLRVAAQEPFDAVVSDFMLPDLDAGAFHDELRAIRPTLAARFLVITGDTAGLRALAGVMERRLPILWKPFESADLIAAVIETVDRLVPVASTGTVPPRP